MPTAAQLVVCDRIAIEGHFWQSIHKLDGSHQSCLAFAQGKSSQV
jgi:hypothetical protein